MLLNNRYRIIRTLGGGGFSETFLAEDTQMPSRRNCVIKQLKPIYDNPQVYHLVQERFGREAAILEELGDRHPQIPRLYAYFQTAGQFYLIQEYIEGQTLSGRVKQRGCLNESETRAILIDLLQVLQYVHSQGIIHRDIKPENIIIRASDNKPVLIDFGAVRETMTTVVNSQGNATSSIVIGTPGFMAGEQAAGRPIFASDLYSLGLVAIYLLTAKIPQELQTDTYTGEFIWQHHNISPNLSTVLKKAIRCYGRERFPTAKAMLDALHHGSVNVAKTQPTVKVTAPPEQQKKPPAQPTTKKGEWLSAILIGGVVGAALLAAFIILQPRQPRTIDNATEPSVKSTPTIQPTRVKLTPNTPVEQSFYYLADSAFENINNAENQIRVLKNSGYNESGKFWLRDYPNLSNKPYHQVYVAKFNNRSRCIQFLKRYIQRNQNAYCANASTNPDAASDYIFGSQVAPQSTKPSPDQAVRNYYEIINNRDYTNSWNKLSPRFQRNKSNNSYSEYVAWWNKVDRVEVVQAKTVSKSSQTATVEARLKYYLKSGQVVADANRFEFVWNRTQQAWNFDDGTKLN